MGWKIPDKITAIPQDNDLVPFDQGGILRKSTWQKIKEYMLGAATLKTTSQEVIGAVNELKETSDSHTTELENHTAQLSQKANDSDSNRTTTAKDITGAINELNANIALKSNKSELDSESSSRSNGDSNLQAQINNLAVIPTPHYEKCTNSDDGALLIVASGATAGQINLSSVTPTVTGYTPVAGDYVRYVYGSNSEVVQARGVFDVLNSRIASLENLVSNLEEEIILNPSYTQNYYININGGILDYTGLQYSDIITLNKGDVLKVTTNGVSNQVSIITKYNSDLTTWNSSIYAGTNAVQGYYHVCESDCEYIKVCGSISNMSVSKFKMNTKYDLENKIELYTNNFNSYTPNLIDGSYITQDGYILAENGYKYSNLIQLNKDDTIKIIATGFGQNVGILTKWDSSGNYISTILKSNGNGNPVKTSYTCQNAKEFIRISANYSDFTPIIMLIKSENNDIEFYKELFENVICIGDSLTEGDYETNGNYDVRIHSYPYFIQKLTGWTVTNSGASGSTPTTYWGFIQTGQDTTFTGYSGESHHRYIPTNFASYDTAIICLGENEGLTDTLTADTTITTGQTYLNYANTNTGNYCKIIEKLLADNPKIKIFLCAVPQNKDKKVSTNAVIQQIANKYSLPYLDLYNYCIMTEDLASLYMCNDPHYNKLGYLTLAKTIKQLICEYVSNNSIKYIS